MTCSRRPLTSLGEKTLGEKPMDTWAAKGHQGATSADARRENKNEFKTRSRNTFFGYGFAVAGHTGFAKILLSQNIQGYLRPLLRYLYISGFKDHSTIRVHSSGCTTGPFEELPNTGLLLGIIIRFQGGSVLDLGRK